MGYSAAAAAFYGSGSSSPNRGMTLSARSMTAYIAASGGGAGRCRLVMNGADVTQTCRPASFSVGRRFFRPQTAARCSVPADGMA